MAQSHHFIRIRRNQFICSVQHGGNPVFAFGLKIQIGIHPLQYAAGTQRLEPRIEIAGGFAEVLVAGVAQTEHCVPEPAQLRRPLAVQKPVEGLGTLRRLPFAVSTHYQ